MAELTNPSQIAREALRRLASQRIPPTPENYREHYLAIAGIAPDAGNPGSAAQAADPQSPDWRQLILALLKEWDTPRDTYTPARKRESIERIVRVAGPDMTALAGKLQKLLDSWSDSPASDIALKEASGASADAASTFVQLRELLVQTLQFAVVSQLADAPELAAEAESLAQAARAAVSVEELKALAAALKRFWFKLEMHGGESAEQHQGLLRLLQLLVDNAHELLTGDPWLHGQMEVIRQIVARPLDLPTIQQAERRLKDVAMKQGILGASLQEAKQLLKNMVTSFIDRVGELSESTGSYRRQLEAYETRIRQTDDILQLNVVIAEVLRDTREAQRVAGRTREELMSARRQVQEAEAKVQALQEELEQVSELAHEDELTGTLNRRGLENTFAREAARAERTSRPLCVSLLDVDNVKALNDRLGHKAGDDALQHLVRVVKRSMRPSDVLARYGGEEFLLLLPETELDQAIDVMVRLQRNLTKAFFLHNNERVLITFSAGVAQRQLGEEPAAAIERADKGLYEAKKAGKNRVLAG